MIRRTIFVLLLTSFASATNFYIAPGTTGSDSNVGTSPAAPWQHFSHAVPLLNPGDTLNLLNGTYTPSANGMPLINCSSTAHNGTSSAPITFQAVNERQAFLAGDGSTETFEMFACSYWNVIGIHAESVDLNVGNTFTGDVFAFFNGSNHLTVRRNIGAKPNRFGNVHVFNFDNSSNNLVEENEAYFCHRVCIVFFNSSTNNEVRRNYANNRNYMDIPGGYPNGGTAFGIVPYSSNSNLFENNIAEDVQGAGFNAENTASFNHFFGNVSGPNNVYSFRSSPHTIAEGQQTGNLWTNNVSVLPTFVSFWDRGNNATYDHDTAILNGSFTGGGVYQFDVDPSIGAFPSATFTVTNSTAQNATGAIAYRVANTGGVTWSYDHDNSFGNATAYNPNTNVTNPNSSNPAFGSCYLWVPLASPLHGAGSTGDIGANVLTEYVGGVLTTIPLWNGTTGAPNFAGAIVPGLNDVPGTSLINIAARLNINQNGCSFPAAGAQANFSPSPLPFGTVAVSSTQTLTATLQNTGSSNLTFSPAVISGLNTGDFVIVSTTCVSPLAPSASCTYSLRFQPQAVGSRSANLTLTSNAPGSPQQLPMSGTGGTVAISVNPTSLSFGTIVPSAGGTSCSLIQTTTVTSTGSLPLVLATASITGANPGDFQFGGTGTCPSMPNLSTGASCTLSAKFCPLTAGSKAAILNIPSNAPTTPTTVPLSGTGGSSTASLTPATFNYGNQQVGTSSAAHTFTYTNTGTLALSITNVTVNSSSYSVTDNCPRSPSTLAPAGTCLVNVTFTPLSTGLLSAVVTVTGGATQTSAVSGTGTTANITLSPSTVSFGNVLVGTTTASTVVTISNTGGSSATIGSVTAAAPFNVASTTCGSTLPGGGSCTASVRFSPTATGLFNGQLVVADNAPGNPHSAALSGTGTAPAITLTPASNAYGNQPVGTTSAAVNFTYTNNGTGPVSISSVGIVGANPSDFLIGTNTCAATPTLSDTFSTGTLDGTKWVKDVGNSPAPGTGNTGTFSASNVFLNQGMLDLMLTQVAGSPILSTGAEVRSINTFGYGTYTWIARAGSTATTPNGSGSAVSGQVTGLFNYFQDNGLTAPNFTEDDFEIEGQFPTQLELTSWSSASPKVNTFTSFITSGLDTGFHQYTYIWAPGRIDYYFDGTLISTHTTNVPSSPAYIIQNFYGTNATTFGGLATTGSTRHLYISSFSYTPSSTSVAAGASCTVGVSFKPVASGARSGTLQFIDNASGSPHTSTLTGTGTSLTITLIPSSLTFGSTTVGVPSATQAITLTNTGNIVLSIASIVATGDYSRTTTCGATVAAGANCTITVTFTPTATGTRTGAITVTDNAFGSPQTVPLTGTGTAPTAPIATITPSTLTFGNQVINTTSSSQAITLQNTGTATMNITSIVASGDFARTTTCGSTLATSTSCTVNVTFTPTALGLRSGLIIFTDDAAGSPQTVGLSGTGVSAPAPQVSISPTSLTFANQTVGTTSGAQALTLTNTGNATLNIASIVASGDYIQGTTCLSTLAAGANCAINVQFQPTATGTRTGAITVTDNAQGSPQAIPLTGTGIAATAPVVSLSPTSINFGSVPLGTTTNIAATSTGWANCITVACAGGAVDATSATQTFGASSLLTVVGPPHSNALFFYKLNGSSRNGVTNWLDDFIVNIGSSGASAQTFEYDIGHFVSGTAFLYGTQCNQVVGFWQVWNELAQTWVTTSLACSLPVSTDHHIIWSFSRSGSNMIYNSVTIDGVLHPINMTEPSGPRPTFTDAVAVNFQMDIGAAGTSLNETVKSANIWANPQTVTLTNTGNATLNIASITASGDFSVPVTTCGSTLSALASCVITIGFAPSAVGTRNGTLTITDNAAGSPHTVPLTGVGTNATTPVASISPTSLTFANQIVGTTSTGQNLTLTNTGNGTLNITSITASGDYARTTTCGATLAAAASCSISVTFTPTAQGTRTGAIAITDNAAGSPQMVSLTGTGVPAPQPAVSFSPATLTFPNTFVGVTTPTQDITLTNTGTATLNIASIVASGDYARTTSCGATLAPSAPCLIHVSFTPTAPGPRAGLISVTDDAPGSPQTVSLNGQGIATAPAVCLNRSSVPFGNQPVGTTSGTQPVVVTDCGTAPLIVSSVTPSSNFTAATTCTTVAVGATCNVNIAFAPSTTGTLTGTVQIASNAASSPDVITTSGFGTQTGATITPTSVSFGTVVVGVQSAGTLLTLTNTGNTTITPNTPTFSGTNPTDFSFTGSCPTLAVNASCTYNVFFTPGSAGARSGVFNQTFTGAPSPVTVTLTGTGQATAPTVTLTPSSINFGSVTQGASTPVQTIQLTNSGTANLVVTSVTATGTNSGDVTLSADQCTGVTVVPGVVCTVNVAMTPASTGARSANAHFITNAASSPDNVTLAVIGLVAPAPQATFTPTTLAFGNVKTGTTSAAQTVTVGNIGNANLTISSVTLAGANPTQYSQTNNCATVIPNLSCAVTVNFSPTTTGSKPATLVIVSNDPTNPTETITLSGTGRGHPKAVIGVTAINFGSTTVGTTSGPAVFTITNTGDATLNVSTITTVGDTFPQNNTCTCCPVAPATSCAVTVQFNPQTLCGQPDPNNPTSCLSNVHLGSLTVTSDADQSPQNVALQGLAIPVPPPPGPITITIGGAAGIGGVAVIGVQ